MRIIDGAVDEIHFVFRHIRCFDYITLCPSFLEFIRGYRWNTNYSSICLYSISYNTWHLNVNCVTQFTVIGSAGVAVNSLKKIFCYSPNNNGFEHNNPMKINSTRIKWLIWKMFDFIILVIELILTDATSIHSVGIKILLSHLISFCGNVWAWVLHIDPLGIKMNVPFSM